MKRTLIAAVFTLILALGFCAAGLAEGEILWLGGVGMKAGDYLASGANATTTTRPDDNYAHLSSDGKTLTLHNYSYAGSGYQYNVVYGSPYLSLLFIRHPLTLQLDENTSNSLVFSGADGINTKGIYLDDSAADLTITGSGSLNVKNGLYLIAANGSDVSINGGSVTLETTVPSSFGIWLVGSDGDFALGEGALLKINTRTYGILTTGSTDINGGTLSIESGSTGIDARSDLTISGGAVTVKNGGTGLQTNGNATISGGTVDITGKGYGISAGGLAAISGGTIKIDNSAGTQHAIAGYGVDITGGVLDLTSRLSAVRSINKPITCTLAMPDGAAILSDIGATSYYYLDFTASYENSDHTLRTIHLPYVPAAPSAPADVPTTGDSAPLAAWFALAALSAACGAWLVISRKRAL